MAATNVAAKPHSPDGSFGCRPQSGALPMKPQRTLGYVASRTSTVIHNGEVVTRPIMLLPSTFDISTGEVRRRAALILQCPPRGLYARGVRILPAISTIELLEPDSSTNDNNGASRR